MCNPLAATEDWGGGLCILWHKPSVKEAMAKGYEYTHNTTPLPECESKYKGHVQRLEKEKIKLRKTHKTITYTSRKSDRSYI